MKRVDEGVRFLAANFPGTERTVEIEFRQRHSRNPQVLTRHKQSEARLDVLGGPRKQMGDCERVDF